MTPRATLADLVVTHPGAARVFHRYRLDYCCGGRRGLDEACRERSLDPAAILDLIAAENSLVAGHPRWDEAPLPALIDHIVGTYHRRLRDQLPHLIDVARLVETRHAGQPTRPRGLAEHLAAMRDAVFDHLRKEEAMLFPLIAAGDGARAAAPVHVLEIEHEHLRQDLLALRQLTDDLRPPAEACPTWRALYLNLLQFEAELMDHMHLENNVLFRRALVSEYTGSLS